MQATRPRSPTISPHSADGRCRPARHVLRERPGDRHCSWPSPQEPRLAIVVWIERKRHRQRPQDILGGLTPIEFEAGLPRPGVSRPKPEPVSASDPNVCRSRATALSVAVKTDRSRPATCRSGDRGWTHPQVTCRRSLIPCGRTLNPDSRREGSSAGSTPTVPMTVIVHPRVSEPADATSSGAWSRSWTSQPNWIAPPTSAAGQLERIKQVKQPVTTRGTTKPR